MGCSKLEDNEKFFLGDSMSPTIEAGSKLIWENVPVSSIALGDIIIFKTPAKLVCHRLIARYKIKDKIFFLERGDSRFCNANLIQLEAIVGKVTKIETKDKETVFLNNRKTSFLRQAKFLILGYGMMWAHYLKRILFGRRQNRLTQRLRFLFLKGVNSFL